MERENNTKKEITMDELAAMVQNGFLGVEGKIEKVQTDIKEIKTGMEEIGANLNKKTDIVTHNDLKYRVEKLEEKVGVTLKKNLAAA